MIDTQAKAMSSIVVAERKHHKPAGGCVGALFHLFDWNRKLSKKKLFPKKLLPVVTPKQLAKKFGKKLPTAKLLIADENRGGFPNTKKPETNRTDVIVPCTDSEMNRGMRAPGVVARLMGLEAMPVRDVPERNSATLFESQRKVSESCCFDHDLYSDKQPTICIDDHTKQSEFYCYNHDQKEEIVSMKPKSLSGKLELIPQKLQKIGFFQRRAVSRFQSEAVPFKRVISYSRKHQQKLVSPVKSPQILSGKNAVRLMEAATKILEPGLQATNRAKCAITYCASPRPSLREQVSDEEPVSSRQPTPAESLKQPKFQKPVMSLKGQFSCKNLENLFDIVGFRSNIGEQDCELRTSASSFSYTSAQESAMGKLKSPSSLEQERVAETLTPTSNKYTGKSVLAKNQDRTVSLAIQSKDNVQQKTQQGQTQKVEKKQDNQRQNRILTNDKVTQNPKFWNQESRRDHIPLASFRADNQAGITSKDHFILNKNLKNSIGNKTNAKVLGNCKEPSNGKEGSEWKLKTLPQKRRPISCNSQIENTGTIKSAFSNGTNGRNSVTNGEGIGLNPRSVNRNCVKNKTVSQMQGLSKNIKQNSGSTNSEEMDVVSFMTASPMKPDGQSFSSVQMEKKKISLNGDSGGGLQQKMKNRDKKHGKLLGTGLRSVEGDTLNALLEHKLRELKCLDGIELASLKNSPSGRSTASLLQELLSALTAERSIPQKHDGNFSYNSPVHSECSSTSSQNFTTNRKIQGELFSDQCRPGGNSLQAEKKYGCSIGLPHAKHGDHPSPVSILEASFSSESCSTSHSLDSNLVDQIHLSLADCSLDKPQPFYTDMDLYESGTSTNMWSVQNDITDTTIDISKMCAINHAEIGLTGSEPDYVEEVVSNAELLFENVALYGTDSMGGSILDPLLFDLLETVADALWRSPKSSLAFVEAKNRYQFRKILFDCMVECLDLKYSRYCRAGFKAWAKLPSYVSRERLSREVDEEIRRWRCFAGMLVDEIIEKEMSSSWEEWTHFEIEAFETGISIESDILQLLVDEMVIDLLRVNLG